MIYYFAYGSNLHPMRFMERASSAELIGVTKHHQHSLTFHKKSDDGSSKCNMLHTGDESDLIYGAIYKLKADHKAELDRFEGKGYGYLDNQIKLQHNGDEHTCFTYLAQQSHIVENLKPYHWYKQLVLLGAKYLKFPDSYISTIKAIESTDDPDLNRKREREALIEQIIKYR